MVQKLNKILLIAFCLLGTTAFSQEEEEGVKPPQIKDYNNDSTFKNFARYRDDVAKAQVNALKNGGALLIRLKTNVNTITKLKNAGKVDLATQVERETFLNNKAIVRGFTNQFKFCPVYFFYSNVSDSVKHKNTTGIFLDTNLTVDPAIICTAGFYLIAEQGTLYSSSIGLTTEAEAVNAREKGTAFKDFAIVVKNRYFIQLHEPFPYFQKGYKMKTYGQYVKNFNDKLQIFYTKYKSYNPSPEIKQYIY
ncbi:MAG: hypothetical protein V4506_09095 [Bacteroidota bacterium]